jgi:hypothetical protein
MLFPQPEAVSPQGIVHDLGQLGVPPALVVGGIAAGLLVWALSHSGLRNNPDKIAWGVAAGLAVAGSFLGTSWLAAESLGAVPVEGPSFVAPVGRTLIFLMTSTAGGITFAVGSVVGVMAGALIGSMIRGLFRWEACEDPRELQRQVGGAALMGIGGVVAMGCSVGQGVTGFATLAWSGPVTLIAIASGALFGLRHLIAGFQPE